jgi:hypothetical protein
MMPNEVEQKAISVSKQYYESKGYSVEDVRRNPLRRGYDLFATKGQENVKIKVKGCTRMWQIPEFHESVFDKEPLLVADLLCVVYVTKPEEPKLLEIPRNEILPNYLTPRKVYRMSSEFTNQRTLEKFLVDWPATPTVRPPSSHRSAS